MNNVVYVKTFENGKLYVGITKQYKKRMWEHKWASENGSQLLVHKAMRKYNHETEIVFQSECYDDVLEMEKVIIQNFKDLGYELYNMTIGGEGQTGRRVELDYYMYNPTDKRNFKYFCKRNELNYEEYIPVHTATQLNRTKIFIFKHKSSLDSNSIEISNCYKRNKPIDYYSKKEICRCDFKKVCNNNDWNINDFEEVFSGIKTKRNEKKYYYIYKEVSR